MGFSTAFLIIAAIVTVVIAIDVLLGVGVDDD